ncbi:MAG: DUF5985 family protein [Caulobacteraceae bacterium]
MSLHDQIAFFVSGALCAGYIVTAAFFLRFWTRTRDRFFGAFAVAFLLMGANQAVASFFPTPHGENSAAYALRILAFALIIAAVLDKNASGKKG